MFMEDMKISVIVPVYNIKEYLKKCVDSIGEQTYKNLEIILVDDGSTDGSGAICDEYRETDSRVIVIHQQNSGVSAARNTGVQAATGAYITFVDSDDYLERDMYEKMLEAAVEKDLDVIACGYFYTNTPQELDCSELVELLSREKAISLCLADDPCSTMCGAVWNKLYKTSVLRQYLVFNSKYIIAEDMLVTVRCLKYAKTIGQLNWCGYHYVQRKDSIVNSFKAGKSSSVYAHQEIYEELKTEYPNLAEAVKIRNAEQSYHLLSEAITAERFFQQDIAVLQKDLKENRKYLKSSLHITGIRRIVACLLINVRSMPKLLWLVIRQVKRK